MKAIHLVLIAMFGVAAFVLWRVLRQRNYLGEGYRGIVAAPGGPPWGPDTNETNSKSSKKSGFAQHCAGFTDLAGEAGMQSGHPKAQAVGVALKAGGPLACKGLEALGGAAKVGAKYVGKAAKAVGKGTVVATKATVGAVKSGTVKVGKEFKAVVKNPTAIVKSTPLSLAVAPQIVATKVAVKGASVLVNKAANIKLSKPLLIAAAPVVVPTKVAAKAAQVTGKLAAKGASKVASGAKSVAKKLKFW